MLIGIPKEVLVHEYRVGMNPAGVRELTLSGHQVLVEHGAGVGVGFSDQHYQTAGAIIVDTAEEIFDKAEMIVKVKEPQPNECKMLHRDQLLFTYLHLAPDPEQAQLLQESGCTAVAYETITGDGGVALPLLAPMSQIAGRMSIQAGAHFLEKAQGGHGVLLGGVPGVASANVVIIGGGVAGTNAIRVALGMGANVIVLDKSLKRLSVLESQFGVKLHTIYSTIEAIEEYVLNADLVIGAVLVPGGETPKLIGREFLQKMKKGSVMVDISIDQGGCFATSHPTTHDDPTYVIDGIIHYCVTNMPGAVARTASFALNNATLPFIVEIANRGVHHAMEDNPHLLNGLNVHHGQITHAAVAMALHKDYVSAREALCH